MKAIIARYLPILPFITFAMMAIQVLVTWDFVGWVHYDSQYRTLPKDSYLAELVTAEDYAKLQTHSLQEVKLSNGSTITDRQPVWYETVLPNYKKVGDHYLLVTMVGTAHYYPRWIEDTFPLMLLTVWGLFITQWDLRRRYAKTSGPDSNR
jgi:hypothetical protein